MSGSTRREQRRKNSRRGALLLEVLLAAAILAMSITLLSQLSRAGTRLAILGQLQSEAAVRCETKLNELLVGASDTPVAKDNGFLDDAKWRWSATTKEDVTGLTRVTVAVWREGRFSNASRIELIRLVPANHFDPTPLSNPRGL